MEFRTYCRRNTTMKQTILADASHIFWETVSVKNTQGEQQ